MQTRNPDVRADYSPSWAKALCDESALFAASSMQEPWGARVHIEGAYEKLPEKRKSKKKWTSGDGRAIRHNCFQAQAFDGRFAYRSFGNGDKPKQLPDQIPRTLFLDGVQDVTDTPRHAP